MKKLSVVLRLVLVVIVVAFGMLLVSPKTTYTTENVEETPEVTHVEGESIGGTVEFATEEPIVITSAWYKSYNWSALEDKNVYPEFNRVSSMPVNLEEFLSHFAAAKIYGDSDDGEIVVSPATELIHYTKTRVYNIYLYTTYSAGDFGQLYTTDLAIPADKYGYGVTLEDLLAEGYWEAGRTVAFGIEEPEGEKKNYCPKRIELLLDTYGRPDEVIYSLHSSDEGLTEGGDFCFLWSCGDDYFYVNVTDLYNGESNITLLSIDKIGYYTNTMYNRMLEQLSSSKLKVTYNEFLQNIS